MRGKVKLIFNPIANLGRAWNAASALRPIVAEHEGADWTGTVFPTHATELARQAAEDGYELVIAMGGDGTMHEVMNGLMQVPAEKRPKLGLVPLGSGNDLAYACGISAVPEEALRQAFNGTPHYIDVARIKDDYGREEFWANAVGIGFDTIVTIKSRKVKNFQGFAAYLIAVFQTILFQYEQFHLNINIDGKNMEKDSVFLVLMNGKREGGGFHVTPDAVPDDGLLDYLLVDKVSRLKMLRILPEVLKGTQAKMKECHLGRFEKMEIQSDRPLFLHVDGEIFATPSAPVTHLTIEMIKSGIQVVR